MGADAPASPVSAVRYRADRFMLAEDGIPIRKVAAPLARRFQQVCASIIAESLDGTPIVQLEYAALIFIDDMPGIDQRRLAEAMGVDRNNASLLLEQLERKGLVLRRVNSADRRAREVFLTRKGESLCHRLRPAVRRANEQILAPLKPGERELFLDMLVRVVVGNRVHARPGAGRRKPAASRSSPERK
jgi:DNA-binding MarR family transcriptional regulator